MKNNEYQEEMKYQEKEILSGKDKKERRKREQKENKKRRES